METIKKWTTSLWSVLTFPFKPKSIEWHRNCDNTPFCQDFRIDKVKKLHWIVLGLEHNDEERYFIIHLALIEHETKMDIKVKVSGKIVHLQTLQSKVQQTIAGLMFDENQNWNPEKMIAMEKFYNAQSTNQNETNCYLLSWSMVKIEIKVSPFVITIIEAQSNMPVMHINEAEFMRLGSETGVISTDFSFIQPGFLTGLPLRTSRLILEDTMDRDKPKPLRAYNADVFGYPLNEAHRSIYGIVPLIMHHSTSSTSCSILWNNPSESYFDIWSQGAKLRCFSEHGSLDAYLTIGRGGDDLLHSYVILTGLPQLPPLWSLGYHQCKWNYWTEQEVLVIDNQLACHNIPCDCIWLDIEHTQDKCYFTWDKSRFPNPSQMQETLFTGNGRRLVAIVDPHVKLESLLYTQIVSQGYAIMDTQNQGPFQGLCWPGQCIWVDFLNQAAREWWAGLYRYDKYLGSTPALFTWNDMNEPSVFDCADLSLPKNVNHCIKIDSNETVTVPHGHVHNLYGYLMHRASYHGLLTRDNQSNPDAQPKKPFILTRSFYAGSQRYGWVWTGDTLSDWSYLRASIPMLLSLGMAGMGLCGADVGGFFGNPSSELLARWYQLGSLQPFFRAHSHLDSVPREPFKISDAGARKAIIDAIRLRYSLLPYLFTCFYEQHITGVPVMRPPWLFDLSLAAEHNTEEVFMLGPCLRVHPVLYPGIDKLSISLPPGSWFLYHTMTRVPVHSFNMAIDLQSQPVFARGGSIIPVWETVRHCTRVMHNDPITLLVFPDDQGQASGTLYYELDPDLQDSPHCHLKIECKEIKNIPDASMTNPATTSITVISGNASHAPRIKCIRVASA